MNSVVTDGVQGFTAKVDSAGNLLAKVSGTVAVSGTVPVSGTVVAQPSTVERSGNVGDTVTTSSDELVPEATDRQAIYFYNAGSKDVHISFGTTPATSDDFKLAPGEKYGFETVGDEAVYAVAVGGSSYVTVIEWVLA